MNLIGIVRVEKLYRYVPVSGTIIDDVLLFSETLNYHVNETARKW